MSKAIQMLQICWNKPVVYAELLRTNGGTKPR